MKQTKLIMGMPITVEVVGSAKTELLKTVFDYFRAVDARFSTYKPDSEISQINRGLAPEKWSPDMQEIMRLAEETKRQTDGYFDIEHGGRIDPTGIVKGWAIWKASQKLLEAGANDFYIEAGGDIQTRGHNAAGGPWRVGIRNPFNTGDIIKTVELSGEVIATSGDYIRGQHIYDPHGEELSNVRSLTVIGPPRRYSDQSPLSCARSTVLRHADHKYAAHEYNHQKLPSPRR
jgi:thiamine biosynthesis lipoprotein